jgi:glucokinase
VPARYLGLDLGGTNIKYAIVEDGPEPRVVAEGKTETDASEGPSTVVTRMVELGRRVVSEHGAVEAVGAGIPGVLDYDRGRALFLPNLPGSWADTPLADSLSAGLGVAVSLINDARAFTLGELRLGAGKGCEDVVCVGVGTGIGGGVAIDGQLHLGLGGTAGEFGHQTIEPEGPRCACGNRGCVEALAAGPAIAREGGKPTPELVAEAAHAGDARAREAITHAGQVIGIAVANAVVLLAPQRVVIGGGVAAAGHLLLDPIRAEVKRRVFVVPIDRVEIVAAALGPFAGAVGAALWGAEARAPR